MTAATFGSNLIEGGTSVYFTSPSKGKMTLTDLLSDLHGFVQQDPNCEYKMVIGTDSQRHGGLTQFVTAIVMHRVGRGARFYYTKRIGHGVYALRQRIYMETQFSLEVVEALNAHGLSERFNGLPVEIHIDVGQDGETRILIQEVVGWVTSVGYTAKIKPFAFGASAVADRFSKKHVSG